MCHLLGSLGQDHTGIVTGGGLLRLALGGGVTKDMPRLFYMVLTVYLAYYKPDTYMNRSS
jgi:hypothetical protein